jgi:hypothetical protein
MSKMKDLKRLVKAINFDTPEEVADFLHKRGIKGNRVEANSCPVAQYITSSNFGFEWASVFDTVGAGKHLDDVGVSITTPTAVRTFVSEFDLGKYPHLVQERTYDI